MRTIRYRSRGQDVYLLEEILVALGYSVVVSTYFGKDTKNAVQHFQEKHELVIDGIVGLKTWSKLIETNKNITAFNKKLLSEKDIIDFANTYNIEIPLVKAVNEVESNGKGFLLDGRPRILFEGHVFWRELVKRNIDPQKYVSKNTKEILYKKWTKIHYKGGAGEYIRLEKAAHISENPYFKEAAYIAASWGSFQIMGFHYKNLGYDDIDHFVSEMYQHERTHLNTFGKFIENTVFKGKSLLYWLATKNWTKFAEGYNGIGYKRNKYDQKLLKSYNRYV